MTVEFKEWPKIPRGGGPETVTITEKIDGTNACVIVENDRVVGAQSRNHLLTSFDSNDLKVVNDNMGFANWVCNHALELAALGEGYHYGEWAGLGIQGNPHKLPEKQFFLFNVGRWNINSPPPECCKVVPTLYVGEYINGIIDTTMENLRFVAEIEGYTPEGIVVYYHKSRRYEKITFKNSEGKWKNDSN